MNFMNVVPCSFGLLKSNIFNWLVEAELSPPNLEEKLYLTPSYFCAYSDLPL